MTSSYRGGRKKARQYRNRIPRRRPQLTSDIVVHDYVSADDEAAMERLRQQLSDAFSVPKAMLFPGSVLVLP